MFSNEDILRKIQGLLAKAESTEFGAESEALYSRAQELMLRYAIDEEEIRRAKPKVERQKPVIEEFIYSETGRARMPKVTLLNTIALANRCKVVLKGGRKEMGPQIVWIAGFPDDISFVKLLYASLSISVLQEGKRKFKESGSDSFSNFIRNFYDGFTLAIGKRLREQNEQTTKDVGESRALVLYDRKKEVEDAVQDKFGRLRNGRSGRSKSYDDNARGQGFSSGMSANIRPGQGEIGGGRKLIG